MKIDDKEIEIMLEDFSGKNIDVPKELDEKLNKKLENIRPKKTRKSIIAMVASILVMTLSYTSIPSFKTFADEVFRYIFGDIGIDNAVDNGYELIPSQTINIEGYDIQIDNIYMDKLRLGFDVTLKSINNDDTLENHDEILDLSISGDSFDGSYGLENAMFRKENDYKSKIEVLGEAVTNLYNKKQNEINLELILTKTIGSRQESEEVQEGEKPPKTDDKIIGKYNLVLNMPKEVYDNKEITINENINDDRLNLDIQKLDISPTMMYLHSKGSLDGHDIQGLYNVKIISENNMIYKDNLSLIGRGNSGQWQQTIVPSIYYDESDKFKLVADGAHVSVTEDIEINVDDTYPKEINYFGETITLNKVEQYSDRVAIEIAVEKNVDHISGSISLDEVDCLEWSSNSSEEGKEIYKYYFDIEKKDKYNLNLNLIMKYPKSIELEFKKN